MQKDAGVDYIPSNEFSFYDGMLDLTMLLNAVPKCYKALGISEIDTYFAMARGYQGEKGDVQALAMKKWFNTNYHYIVPELFDETKIRLTGNKPFTEYEEAKLYGIETKPVIIGPVTFLKLAIYHGTKTAKDFAEDLIDAYIAVFHNMNKLGVSWLQLDEPILVTDLSQEDIVLFTSIYQKLLAHKGKIKVLLQTYFGDVRDCYKELVQLNFDGIGLDFLEGKMNAELIKINGFPKDKVLFAGIVNGKNIWKCDYKKALHLINQIHMATDNIVISTSCSLLHVPYTLENEKKLSKDTFQYFTFAKEKLYELKELCQLAQKTDYEVDEKYINNQSVFATVRVQANKEVQYIVNNLKEEDFNRIPDRKSREQIQKDSLKLPLFPTTTIGSFPQTLEVKQNRTKYKKGEITKVEYDAKIKSFINDCIALQEELGLDVLVHGEYERNDMVEFFGENLEGYVFTEKAWVQSYGTRCVKPPIIFGDIRRSKPITVSYTEYANSLTKNR